MSNTGLAPLRVSVSSSQPWMQTGTSGIITIGPAGTVDIPITLDTSGLSGGASGSLSVRTSDPARATLTVPVTATVNAPGAPALAFDVENRPWDQRVRVYGDVAQFSDVRFTESIPPDPALMEPCVVYDASGATTKGVGQVCTDFGADMASAQLFGTGRDGALAVTSGQTVYTDNVRAALTQNAQTGQTSLAVASVTGLAPGDEVLTIQTAGGGAGVYEFSTVEIGRASCRERV